MKNTVRTKKLEKHAHPKQMGVFFVVCLSEKVTLGRGVQGWKILQKNEIKNKSTFIHIDFFDFGVKKVDFREKKQKGLRFLERVEGRKRKKSVVYC